MPLGREKGKEVEAEGGIAEDLAEVDSGGVKEIVRWGLRRGCV